MLVNKNQKPSLKELEIPDSIDEVKLEANAEAGAETEEWIVVKKKKSKRSNRESANTNEVRMNLHGSGKSGIKLLKGLSHASLPGLEPGTLLWLSCTLRSLLLRFTP